MAFRDYALLHVKDPWGDDRVNLREAALVLAVRTSASQADQEELLRAAFEDQSVYVRLAAAKETAALKLDALSQDVGRVSASAPDSLKVYFCEAARELGTKCK